MYLSIELPMRSSISVGRWRSPVSMGRYITLLMVLSLFSGCATESAKAPVDPPDSAAERVFKVEVNRIEPKAQTYLTSPPLTVTAFGSERSPGGPNDFYSEGDYWWPDPENPDGPYIRRDGLSNPDNFIDHRQALMRFSEIVATLTSAYLMSGNPRYSDQAAAHLRAWFVDPTTRMNPSLLYGQAIKGRSNGRSIGVIDTIHLTEVARSVKILTAYDTLPPADEQAVRAWFTDYLEWLNTHPFGTTERDHPNNHGIAWAMQVGAMADLLNDKAQLARIRADFKQRFVGEMMASDGSFPAELARTKPYGYSLFVLDLMATIAQIASTADDDLWLYQAEDGRGMARAVEFMQPYIRNKASWPLPPDVRYWDEWPVRHPSMAFAALAYNNTDYLSAWQPYEADPTEYEVLRNLPVRHPLLWLSNNLPRVDDPVSQPEPNSVAPPPTAE